MKETPLNKVIKDLLGILNEQGNDIEKIIFDILNKKNLTRQSKHRLKIMFCDILELEKGEFLSRMKFSNQEERKERRRYLARIRYQNNREKLSKYKNQYQKKKRSEDNLYRMKHLMRNVILNSFKNKGFKKGGKAEDIIGCSYEFLLEHLESKFKDGMTWENRGVYGWHIDHIVPLSSASNEDELIKLNHYTNLQPLWALDNLKKSNKILQDATL
jgi:hypothetical protein